MPKAEYMRVKTSRGDVEASQHYDSVRIHADTCLPLYPVYKLPVIHHSMWRPVILLVWSTYTLIAMFYLGTNQLIIR